MNQLSIFPSTKTNQWTLFIDGASRNNPGPASIGLQLRKNDELICKAGYYIGTKTNNQAEYGGLIVGIMIAREHMGPKDTLTIKSDSLLLVRQIAGQYAVKNPELKKLHQCAINLLKNISFSITHVYREENTIADGMANLALDKKIPLPQKYQYE